jgi:prevent-host-death family protein
MKSSWALQDAKNRFSEVVDKALSQGPQLVTRHGRDAVVIVAAKDFNRAKKGRGSLVDFFRKSPLYGVELDLTRSKDTGRKVEL